MIRGLVIREARPNDRAAIHDLVADAFGNDSEARLVEAIVAQGDDVLELVATHEQRVVGHILFSRLSVESRNRSADAVALAPIAVEAGSRRSGVGAALIESAHKLLHAQGETLSVVLGDPTYYGRFGYEHARAAGFESDYQSPSLQALSFGEAPTQGRLVYASAFSSL